MSTGSVGTNERGISEIYGTILVIALAFAVSILIIGAGFLLLGDSLEESDDRVGQDSVNEFESRVSEVLGSVDNEGTWAPPEGAEDDFEANASQGQLTLTVKTTDEYWNATEDTTGAGDLVDASTQEDSQTVRFGTLRHEGDSGLVTAYQGGAVFEKQDDSVSVLEQPNFEVTENRLALNLINISSFPAVSSGEELTIQGDPINASGLQDMVNERIQRDGAIVAEAEINVTIQSEFAEGWGAYAVESIEGVDESDVTYLSDDRVKIAFGTFGEGINLSSGFGGDVIYSGVADLAPEMHDPTRGTITDAGPNGFEVTNPTSPSDYAVGAYLDTNLTDEREWWSWNTSAGKWENVERSNEEIPMQSPGGQFPAVPGGSSTFDMAEETVTCVVEPTGGDEFPDYVESEGDGCLDASIGVNDTSKLAADFQPYMEVTDVDVDPSPRVIDFFGSRNLNVTVDVKNTGPGRAEQEPLGVFTDDTNVGENVVAAENVTLNSGASTTAMVDRSIPVRFLLASQNGTTTTFGVGAATANDRLVEPGWVLTKGTNISDIRIDDIKLDDDDIIAGQTISGEIKFDTTALDDALSDQSISALLTAGPNNDAVDTTLEPNTTEWVPFNLNTDNRSASFNTVTAEIPQVDKANASISVTLPDTGPEFVVTNVDYESPTTREVGESLVVDATIKNEGAVRATQPVQLAINKSGIPGPAETLAVEGGVELGSGEDTEVELVWEPTAVYAGQTYDLSVYTQQDNSSAETVEVKPLPDTDGVFSVDILGSSDDSVTAPGRLAVDVEIENTGSGTAEKLVWLTAASEIAPFNLTSVELTPGETTTKTLYWDTDRDDAGDRTVVVETQDDSDTKDVTVNNASASAELELTDMTLDSPADGTMVAGQQANVTVTVENPSGMDGDLSGSGVVILEGISGNVSDAADTGVLDPGESTTLELSWQSFPGDEGTGNLTAVLGSDTESVPIEVEPQTTSRGPLDVAFVHDESGSMSSSDPDAQRVDATEQFLGDLNESKDRASYVQFDSGTQIEQDLTGDFSQVNSSLNANPGGATDISAGIFTGLTTLDVFTPVVTRTGPEEFTVSSGSRAVVEPVFGGGYVAAPGEQVELEQYCYYGGAICYEDQATVYDLSPTDEPDKNMVLLGDGKHTEGSPFPERAAEVADDAGVTIYTIGLGVGDDSEDTLQAVANETGGQYKFADNADELESVFEDINNAVTDAPEPEFQVDIVNGSLPDKNLGQSVTVEAEVTNVGNASGQRPVWLVEEFSNTPIDIQSVSLDNGSSTTVTFSWDEIDVESSEFSGSPPTATEYLSARTASDTDDIELTVTDEPSFFEINSATLENPGDQPIGPSGEITVSATVENTQSGFDEQDIFLRTPWGAPVDNETVALNGFASTDVTFTWDLSDVRLTRDNVSVTISSDDDDATVADIDLEEITDEIPEYEVANVSTNADVADDESIEAGEELNATAYVRNIGNTTAEQFLKLKDFDGNVVDLKQVEIPNDGALHEVNLTWQTTVYDSGVDDVNVTAAVGDFATTTVNVSEYEPDAEFNISITDTNATAPDSITAGLEALTVDVTVTNTGEVDRAIVSLNNADDLPDAETIPTLKNFGELGDEPGFSETATGTLTYQTTAEAHEIDEIEATVRRYDANDTQAVDITEQTLDPSVEIDAVNTTADSRGDAVTAGNGTVGVTVEFAETPDDGSAVTLYEGPSADSGNLLDFTQYDDSGPDSVSLQWEPRPGSGNNTAPRTLTVSVGGATETVDAYVNEAPSELLGGVDAEQPDPVGIDVDEIQVSD